MDWGTTIRLRVEPSFEEHFEVIVELRSAGDGGRVKVIRKWSRAPRTTKRDLSPQEADRIRHLLDGLRISGVFSAMMGLDGTTYSLLIESYPFATELKLNWWGDPPSSWVGVSALAEALRALGEGCTGPLER